MAKASDNLFPSILLEEATTPATPAAGSQRLFIDVADDTLKRVDAAGTVSAIGGGGGGGTSGRALLDEVVLGSDTANVTFDATDIPASGYRSLLVEILGRVTTAITGDALLVTINGDATDANYQRQRHYGFGSTSAASTASDRRIGTISGANSTANAAAHVSIEVPFYTDTTFYKNLRSFGAVPLGATSEQVELTQSFWRNTAAITSLAFTAAGGSFVTGSRFALYGLV